MSQILLTVRHKQFSEDLEVPNDLDVGELQQILSQGLDWNLPDFWAFFDSDSNREIEDSFAMAGLMDGSIVDIRETGRRSKKTPVLGWQKMKPAEVSEDMAALPGNDGFAWKEV